jgi:hypothetical protein
MLGDMSLEPINYSCRIIRGVFAIGSFSRACDACVSPSSFYVSL